MRPRALDSRHCPACNDDAFHRMQHRRADRRRAGWRASKAKARARQESNRVGALHALSCKGPTRCTCRPIAVYA